MTRVSLQSRVQRLDNARHHGPLRASSDVTMLVMHTTDGGSAASSIAYLNSTDDKAASYHYLIDRNGDILRMTAPSLVAYHAGDSAWPNPVRATPANATRPNGGHSVNRVSIGIAWANKGEPLTDAQIESALWLCGALCHEYAIDVNRVLGHREIAPGRKVDPEPKVMVMDEWRALLARYLADD